MDLFDLFAKISLDTSGYEKGLADASGRTSSFADKLKNGLATAAKVGAAAVGAATTAAAAFAGESVKTGMAFDASMSQVAATMGLTVQDIENNVNGAGDTFDMLREKALQMGSETKFTSQEAAEGLNILAMSGYDATDAVGMIEDVLHLAAAGSMDMASAAGFVSGAMKGFADDTKDAQYYADLMAKGATLANTDVTQLGAALSGGAAAAKSYGQSADTVTIALLRLAEQGETGDAAATALAATMKNLFAPTDQAANAMEKLGVSAFDSSGNARDFNDVVNELNAAMSGLTDQERTQYGQTIFGIQGFDAYNKMVVTSTEKQEEWAEALAGASGEAARQYDTMTDNLVGDIDKWNSALDGFKIALSDELTPSLREFTQFGAESVGTLTAAFKEGSLSGAMEAFGTVLSDGLNMVITVLPDFVNAGMQLLGALGEGLIANLPVLMSAAFEIVQKLVSDITESLPALADGALQIVGMLANGIMDALPLLTQAAIDIIGKLTEGLAENLPQMIESGLQTLLEFSGSLRENAGMLVDAAISLIQTLADGLIEALPAMIETIPLIVSNIANIINDNAPKLLNTAAELIWKLVTGLIDNIPVILENMPQIIAAIWDTIQAINWLDLGSKLIDGIAKGISSMVQTLAGTVRNIMQHPLDFLINLRTQFQSLGKNLIQFFSSGISGMVQTVFGVIRNIGASITNSILNLVRSAKGWGIDMIQGFVNGIASMISRVVDTVKGLADKVRSFLHFSRPDTGPLRDYETWMPDFMKGLANGIDSNAWRVEDAVSGLADKMQIGMDAAFSPELSVSRVATVQESRQSAAKEYGDINININGARYSDEESLAQAVAQAVSQVIQFEADRKRAAYGAA